MLKNEKHKWIHGRHRYAHVSTQKDTYIWLYIIINEHKFAHEKNGK